MIKFDMPGAAMILLFLCIPLMAAESPDLPLIQFSAESIEKRISASSGQVTFNRKPDLPGGQLDVAIHPGADGYPGITIKADGPSWNLAAFGHVNARIRNTGKDPITITIRVDNAGDWKLNPWSAENIRIKPGESEMARVRFGYSWGNPGFKLDAAKVTQVLLFTGKSDTEQSFRIESIEAGGKPGEKPALPPDQVRTTPPGGILLGASTNVDGITVTSNQAEEKIGMEGAQRMLRISAPLARDGDVSVKPAVGRWDLRAYTGVGVDVRNPCKSAITFRVTVESNDGPAASAPITVAAGARQRAEVPFAAASIWNGDPKSGSNVGSDAVSGITIQLPAGEAGRLLFVDSIAGLLSAPTQTPDWLGKRPPVEGKWTQTLNENFDGNAIDPSRWSIYGENYWDKQSHFSKDNVIVVDGMARLRFNKKRGHHNDDPKRAETDYATGFLTSEGKWTQRYGYIEARMKLPTAPGLWPAFWTMPDRGSGSPNRGGTDEGGMEFDIMEFLTRYGPNRYNIAMHWDGYGENHKSLGCEKIYVRADKDGFITSGLLWEPGKLTFYCNGAPVATWANPRVGSVPEYIMFTLPCGGWGGNDLTDAGLPDDFVIDWVRAWQREDLAAAPAENEIKLNRLVLYDVQGLWGGRNVYVSRDGTLWVQIVTPPAGGKTGLQEKRYKLKITPEAVAGLEKLLAENRFGEIAIKERPGIPDEARPTIELVSSDGKTLRKSKWANDKDEHFDAVYQRLLSLIPKAENATPVFDGALDRGWHPEGFGK